jgi:hypothetical protein
MTASQRLNSILNLTFKTGQVFYLTDVYLVTLPIFKHTNPKNTRLDSKIRQNLQILRDLGKLDFVDDNGCYRLK